MNSKYNNKTFKVLMLTILLIAPLAINIVFAQPGPPPPPPPPPPGVPLDGGITLLLGGLAAYGAKKIWGKK